MTLKVLTPTEINDCCAVVGITGFGPEQAFADGMFLDRFLRSREHIPKNTNASTLKEWIVDDIKTISSWINEHQWFRGYVDRNGRPMSSRTQAIAHLSDSQNLVFKSTLEACGWECVTSFKNFKSCRTVYMWSLIRNDD